METAKIKTSTIAQAEIQRRHIAQRMETAKIKTSTTARQRSLCKSVLCRAGECILSRATPILLTKPSGMTQLTCTYTCTTCVLL